MPISVEITCINKRDRKSRHEPIDHVGGMNPDGKRWRLTETAAIQGIENQKWSFWTRGGGMMTEVVIATHNGRKYLKTRADTTTKDNLLSLPERP